MPFARLTLSQAPDAEAAKLLAADLSRLIAADLGKRHELTSVLIETPGNACWTIGSQPQATAAHLEVCVTAGTNSAAEKQSFIRNAMHLLRRDMPALAAATYIVIRELPGSDWGYDGKTQADRAANAA